MVSVQSSQMNNDITLAHKLFKLYLVIEVFIPERDTQRAILSKADIIEKMRPDKPGLASYSYSYHYSDGCGNRKPLIGPELLMTFFRRLASLDLSFTK